MKKQRGVTLLELLIALGLGLLILSGAVRLLSRSATQSRLLTTEIELQENLNYLGNYLAPIFKNALSSPCGRQLDTLLGDNDSLVASDLRRAMIRGEYGLTPQAIGDVITPQTALPAGAAANIIRADDLPLFAVGIAGADREPLNADGAPFSQSLSNIVAGSEYVIVMDSATPIALNLNSTLGITGGSASGGALAALGKNRIPTADMDYRIGATPVPYLITNCQHGDIFRPSAAVRKNAIPIDSNLFFSDHYLSGETILYPLTLYAYYLSQPDGADSPSFSRKNLSLKNATSQPLIGGITDIHYEWGLGEPYQGVQAYVNTQTVLATLRQSDFRRALISVRVTLTAQSANAPELLASDADGNREKPTQTLQRLYTLRQQMGAKR